jgi:hypothetical protein
MVFFSSEQLGAGYFAQIEIALEELQTNLNSKEFAGRTFHKDNFMNKQIGKIISDLGNLRVIASRISSDQDGLEINLDIKSLYIFGKIFIESVVYLCSVFFPDNRINWTKLGLFCQTAEQNQASQENEFKKFWDALGVTFKKLQEEFQYRNHLTHEKRSTVEWTFSRPGHDNLDNTRIQNLTWHEDPNKKGAETTTPRETINILNHDVSKIIQYINNNTA